MALGRKPIEIVNDGKHQLLAKADHWDRIYLKEVAKVQNGYAFSSDYFSKSEGMPLIRIRDIDGLKTVDKFRGKYNEDFVVKKGDILIGMDGDFKVARWKGENALLNQRVCRIIPDLKKYNDKFLVLCLQPFLDAIHAETSSVTVKHISSKTIEEIPLPLPSRKEQQAIVSKIEELFSELDKGIENLLLAQQQLKTYRQSVLKWAFGGKLTNENVKEGELPEGWKKVKLEQVAKFLNGDRSKKYPNRNEYVQDGIPFINTGHIQPNGKLDLISMNYISREKFNNLNGGKIKNGDLVYCLRGATIGKTAFVDQFKEGAIASSLVIIRPNQEDLNNKYLYYFLISPLGKDCISQFDNGSAQPNLSAKNLSLYSMPLAIHVEEQRNIVQTIESRLSVADKMEESITQSLQQAEALRQSILKKAFEGRLV
ncbi:MAG: restriction endonuclease subunit S [Ignavibacteriaceae bacterium]